MSVGTAGAVRLRPVAPWAWLALLVALAYGGAVFNDYVWDDLYFFGSHVWVHDLRTALAAAFDPLLGDISYVRPLPLLTFYAEAIASGRNPAVSHAVNLAIHWGCSVLVFLIARRAFGAATEPGLQKASWMPLALASLFAVHPALSEAPIWISSRFDLMATFWVLLALWVSGLAIRDLPRALTLGTLFFIGALCKESVVVLPLLLGAYALLHGSTSREDGRVRLADAFSRRDLVTYAALVVGGLAYLLIRFQVLSGAELRQVTGPEPVEWFSRITATISTYLQLTVAPFIGSSPHHPWAWPQDGSLATYWQEHVIALSLTTVALTLAATRRPAGWWLLAWLAAYLPVMHLVPLPIGRNIVHQRFMYLPTAALLAFAPYVLARLRISDMARRASLALALALVALSIPVDRSIVKVWKSDLALWTWATQARPESVEARENMVWAYLEADMYEEAEQEFMYIVRNGMRTRATVALNMGTAMYRQERYEEALHYYLKAEPHQATLPRPFRSRLLANLSITHAVLGNAEAAREYLSKSLEIHPRNQVAIGHLLGFCDSIDIDTSGFDAKDVELAQGVRNNTRRLLQERQPELQSRSAFCPSPLGQPSAP